MKYTGVLAEPITAGRLRSPSRAAADRELRRIHSLRMAKLKLLAQFHDVGEGDWLGLALALAMTHVPGFGLISPPNESQDWTEFDKADLHAEVDLVCARTGKGLDAAIQEVIREERWRAKARRLTASALRQLYQQADGDWIAFCEKARQCNGEVSPTVAAPKHVNGMAAEAGTAPAVNPPHGLTTRP